MSGIPTAGDVVRHLNARLQQLGAPQRVDHLNVLPYVNPMWLANWEAPQLAGFPELDDEIRDARWIYPQVLDEY